MIRVYVALTAFVLLTSSLHSQFRTLTSASDLGRLNTSVFSQNRFAGQLSAAYSGNLTVNFQNPSTYTDASLTTIEVGANSISGSFHRNDTSMSSSGVGINHIAILLPLTTGKSGLSFGFTRSSNTNYSIQRDSTFIGLGSLSNQLTGQGNTYLAYVGAGFRFKNLKVGGNLGFNFGQVEHNDNIVFPDSTHIPKIASRRNISEFGIQYILGAQYEIEPTKNKQVILGGYYTGSLSHSGTLELKKQNVFLRSGIEEYVTLNDTTSEIDLPRYSKLGLGASLIQNKTTLFGAEFTLENFSEFKSLLDGRNLQNAWHIHLGGEYKPFMNREVDARKYFNRLTYRAGAVIGKSEQNFAGSLNDIKVMAGATLPIIGRNLGYLTLGAEYGIRGFGGERSQVSENYFSVHLILTFADKWFVRQKFD